jgi:hypothetical protein
VRAPRKRKLFAAALGLMLAVPSPWLHGSNNEPRKAAPICPRPGVNEEHTGLKALAIG